MGLGQLRGELQRARRDFSSRRPGILKGKITIERQNRVRTRQPRQRQRVVRIESNGGIELRDGQLQALGCPLMPMVTAPQIQFKRLDIVGVPSTSRLWPTDERRFEGIHDRVRNLVLDGEDVDQVAIVSRRPELVSVSDVVQPSGYPQPRSSTPDASLDHSIDMKLPPHILDIGFPAAKVE